MNLFQFVSFITTGSELTPPRDHKVLRITKKWLSESEMPICGVLMSSKCQRRSLELSKRDCTDTHVGNIRASWPSCLGSLDNLLCWCFLYSILKPCQTYFKRNTRCA